MGTLYPTAPGSHLAYHGEVRLVKNDVWPRYAGVRNAGSERQSPNNALEPQDDTDTDLYIFFGPFDLSVCHN